jgi:hypothetical protein
MSVNAFADTRKNVIPQPLNLLDKSTLFSIYPKEIVETKLTVFPGYFVIPEGSPEKPSRLVIGASSWWREIFESDQILEIPIHSVMMAKSIVDDWATTQFFSTPDKGPGLFFLPGDLTVEKAQKDFPLAFTNAKERQDRWFLSLVNAADQLWARTNGNPLSIDDNMRLSARMLGLDNKEWLQNFEAVQNTRCPACGTMKNAAFPVCATCGAITDQKKADSLGIKFQGK